MKLGHIDYLNCYPFYYHMFEKTPLPGVQVIPGYPSLLNGMLAREELDASPISAASCADLGDRILLLPGFCLSSVGYVGSVILASRLPLEELDGRTVGLTRASRTSVVLVKILLEKHFRVRPRYLASEALARPDQTDAVLMIGNEAMRYRPDPGVIVHDLGEIWLQKTGFPVVFAVFGIRKAILKKYASEIRSVLASYSASLQCLAQERSRVVACAAARYPDIDYDIDRYFSLLKFEFTDELKRALGFFLSEASGLGLLNSVPVLEYLEAEKTSAG